MVNWIRELRCIDFTHKEAFPLKKYKYTQAGYFLKETLALCQ